MLEKTSIKIYGMTCTLCSATIEARLEGMQGIKNAKLSYANEKALIEYDTEIVELTQINTSIEALGFTTALYGEEQNADGINKRDFETNKLRNQFLFSAFLAAPLILAMLLDALGFINARLDPFSESGYSVFIDFVRYKTAIFHDWRFQLVLATPVQFITGLRFYRNTIISFRVKKLTMDVLVALGTSAAYFYSLYISLFDSYSLYYGMKNIYFEASSVIITLILLGKYLEATARKKTSEAIETLMELAPKTATVIRNSHEEVIPVNEVLIGDIVLVRPFEKITADGLIIEGYSDIDESMLTGESFHIDKGPDDNVTGASVNGSGSFKFRATNVGSDTVLSSIIKLVEEAQTSKAPVQRLADSVSAYFIQFVILTAVLTFAIGYFLINRYTFFSIEKPLLNAVSVLVVSCPCALGLATPAAIMVGMGKGAQNGILIKNGQEIENTCKIDTVVLDKTGTLTTGKLVLTDVIPAESGECWNTEKIIKYAASAESRSEHPLGTAIYQYGIRRFKEELYEVTDFVSVPGKGIDATVAGRMVIIGSEKHLNENGVEVEHNSLGYIGKTEVYMAVDNEFICTFLLADSIKPFARETVDQLKKMGIEVIMLTGDKLSSAKIIGNEVGIEKIVAQVLPQDKAAKIEELMAKGKRVAMVGDGINDAPALATADIGIAIGAGTDVAVETGDIVLIKDDLRAIPGAIRLSKKTMLKIKQNLFWAFVYNIIGIPIAASGNLNPVLAAAAMALSSVSVLLNSISLKRVKLL